MFRFPTFPAESAELNRRGRRGQMNYDPENNIPRKERKVKRRVRRDNLQIEYNLQYTVYSIQFPEQAYQEEQPYLTLVPP